MSFEFVQTGSCNGCCIWLSSNCKEGTQISDMSTILTVPVDYFIPDISFRLKIYNLPFIWETKHGNKKTETKNKKFAFTFRSMATNSPIDKLPKLDNLFVFHEFSWHFFYFVTQLANIKSIDVFLFFKFIPRIRYFKFN